MDKLAAAAGHRPGRAAPAQRDGHRARSSPRAGGRRPGAGRRAARPASASMPLPAPGAPPGRRHPRAARWRVQHHARRGHPPRGRLRGRHQERRLLRGLRRLLDSPRAAALARWRAAGARCTPRPGGGRPGLRVTVQAQIAREELGVEHVIMHPADTAVGTPARRPPRGRRGHRAAPCGRRARLAGGRAPRRCRRARRRRRLARRADPRRADRGHPRVPPAQDRAARPERPGGRPPGFSFAAHRAVVDVDVELGLVRVVEVATAQDVGRAVTRSRSRVSSKEGSRRASDSR